MKQPAFLLVILVICGLHTARAAPGPEQVIELATDSGDWLIEQGQPQLSGTAWPADAHRPDAMAYDLGSGTAGIVVYFLSLHAATGDERYLEAAERGGTYLASLIGDTETVGSGSRRASLYTGIAGIGVALELLADYRPTFGSDVDKVVGLLDSWSVAEPAGMRWSDEFNDLLYGDAGTILFLAWYAQRNSDERAMELAVAGSRFLLAQAEKADPGLYWRFRRSKPFNLPGFSHGTAGIAYVLGTVGSWADERAFTDAAAGGLLYIDSIALVDGDRVRIPYGWPQESWDGLYEFGWAHGLVGSSLFFQRMQQIGINAEKAARYNSLILSTLSGIGLPETPDEPFAEPSTPLDWRFGRAGVLSLLSDSHKGSDTRNAIWRQLSASASRDDGLAYWEVDAPSFMGGGRAAFTGVFHGAAGIGLALLRLHAALVEHEPYTTLPDDPHASL